MRNFFFARLYKYLAAALIVPYVCTLLLTAVACIPKELIQRNMEESALYLTSHETHFMHYRTEGLESSIVDEVADANLLNIGYFWDSEHPLESIMLCRWRFIYDVGENESFRQAVLEEAGSTRSYFRYWHGSLLFVRPLMMVLNLEGIYRLNAVVLFGLLLGLMVLLLRKGLRFDAAALTLSLIAVSIWTVPFCMEFTWMFMVMLAASIVAVRRALQERYEGFPFFCFIVGMVTIFLDFFTNETLTILVPLLLTLRIRRRQGHGENWRFAFRCCFAWACGYIVMWTSKWGIAALILGVDTLGDAMQQASIHLSIEQGMTGLQSMCETLRRNIFCLLPLDMGIKVSVITGVAVIIIMAIHIKRKTIRLRRPTGNVWLYLFLGLLPYLRFIVIRHHSWFHYFFTYRAQAASILALCFAVIEIVEMRRRPTHTVPQTIRHLIC